MLPPGAHGNDRIADILVAPKRLLKRLPFIGRQQVGLVECDQGLYADEFRCNEILVGEVARGRWTGSQHHDQLGDIGGQGLVPAAVVRAGQHGVSGKQGNHYPLAVGHGLPEHPVTADDFSQVLAEQAVVLPAGAILNHQVLPMPADDPAVPDFLPVRVLQGLFGLCSKALAPFFLQAGNALALLLGEPAAGHQYAVLIF